VRAPPLSGFVGLVLRPDADTIATAYELAPALLPPDSEQVLTPPALPHITLTQGALRDADPAAVKRLVADLDRQLVGRKIPLAQIVPFTGGFLFWCVDDTSAERRVLQAAHARALSLADGVLDEAANEAVVAGTAQATGNDPVLVANARRYGYAFVNERYLPHITLGFAPRVVGSLGARTHAHVMTVERVVPVRLGRLGRVEEVLDL
jgi:hypothetical protein